jgi:syndecan 1
MTTDAGAPGAPRFDVVLRGYDRRQVDEHVARLQRVLSRMRADLEMARSQPIPLVQSPSVGPPAPGQQVPPGARPRPTPRPRPGGPMPPGESPDMINNFTDRMQSILQAAEEEAAEIRKKARSAARAEEENVRAQLADLVRQRDAMLAELTRMRGQLEGMLAAPTARIVLPPRDSSPSPARPRDTPSPSPSLPAPSGGSPSSSGTRASGAASPGPSPRAAESSAQSPRPGSTGSTPDGSQADPSRPGQGGSSHAGPSTAGSHGGGGQGGSPRSGSTSAGGGPGASAPGPNRSARPDVPAPKPAPAAPAQSASTGHPAGDSRTSSSAPGRPSSGTSSAPPKPSPGGDQSSTPSSKSAAHRLPSGGYQAVGEQSSSMRPRTESDPEPAALFRPVGGGEADEPQSAGMPRSGDAPSGDRTTVVPTVRPADRSAPAAEAGQPAGKAGPVDTTVKVNSVRPSSGSEATRLTPPVTPASGRTEQKNPTSGGTDDGVRADSGAGGGPGPSGSDRSNRPTSASRSG